MRHLLALFVLLVACEPVDTTISTDGYDASCLSESMEATAQCAAVFTGDVCGCTCTTAAISAGAYDAYQAEWADLQESCGDEIPECVACPDVTVGCVEDTCAVTEAAE